MDVTWLDRPEDFRAVGAEWDAFAAEFPETETTPFHRAAWIHACMASPLNDVFVALVRESAGPLVAGLVFNVEQDAGGAVLYPVRLLGLTPHVSNAYPSRMIHLLRPGWADRLPLVEILRAALDRRRCPAGFFVDTGRESEPLRQAVRALGRERGWVLREGQSSTDAWLEIGDGPEAFMATRSKGLRQNQKTARNGLRKLGLASLVEAVSAGWDWPRIESAIVQAFERCWQVRSPESPLFHAHREPTLQACRDCFEAGLLLAFFYQLDGRTIAFEFGLGGQGVYYPLVRGLDGEFAKFSPGNLLAEDSLAFLCPQGYRAIFLGAIHLSETTKYKARWMSREEPNANLMVIRRASLYGQIDRWYHRSQFFHKLWWKLRCGSHLRRWLA